MMNKFVIVAVLASLAVAHGAYFNSFNDNIVSMEQEGRLLEVPTIGALVLKVVKIGCHLVKSAWSLVGLKVGALALAASAVIWAIKNGFSLVLGAVAAFGFCKVTGKCNLGLLPQAVLDAGESLVYAARQLEDGAALYNNEISY